MARLFPGLLFLLLTSFSCTPASPAPAASPAAQPTAIVAASASATETTPAAEPTRVPSPGSRMGPTPTPCPGLKGLSPPTVHSTPEEVAAYAIDSLHRHCEVTPGRPNPTVVLARRTTYAELQANNLHRAIFEPSVPLMLVILRGGPGDFNPNQLAEVANGGYIARVFRLDNGMPAGMQSSPNGAEFKQLLNDPNLPDEPVPTPTLPPGVVAKAPPQVDLTVQGTGSQTQVVQLKPGHLHLRLTGTISPPPCPEPTPVPVRVTLTNSRGMVIGPFETSVSAGLTTGFPGPGNNSVVPEAGEYTLAVTLPTAVPWELWLRQW